MEKAIYGMAMPFDDSYWQYDETNKIFTIDKTNRESVVIDGIVGATVGHDFSRTLGVSGENLFLQVNERGVFFKLMPDTPLALSTYKKVKRGALRHCSCTYFVRDSVRDTEAEYKAIHEARSRGIADNIIVRKYRKLILFEVCLGNNPGNKSTFCTVDANHPLLHGLVWTNAVKQERTASENRQPFRPRHVMTMDKELSEIESGIAAMNEKLRRL